MLKFVHLSDLHLVPPGGELHGLRPAERLASCVAHIAREHGDAAFCVVSGDLTHDGDPFGYAEAKRILSRLPFPVHLMIGNHDDRGAFRAAFPYVPCDRNGFVQQVIDVPEGRLILLDTHEQGRPEGRLCERRLDWLGAELENRPGPIFLFMHHPPFPVGFDRMDSIRLQDGDALATLLERSNATVRHLFFGHLHRNIAGAWRNWSFSGVRGTNHQIALDFTARGDAPVSLEAPGYAVVRVETESVVVHFAEVEG
ncbi:phosphodiesterase [Devosia sp. CAU 1758]